VELKAGSYHIMLIGLHRDLKEGDTFPVLLQLEKSGTLTVQVQVRQP
jgi:copper(I)-binding protein